MGLPVCVQVGREPGVRRRYFLGSGAQCPPGNAFSSDSWIDNSPHQQRQEMHKKEITLPFSQQHQLCVRLMFPWGCPGLSPPSLLTTGAPGQRLHYLNHHRTLAASSLLGCRAQWGINWITSFDPSHPLWCLTDTGWLLSLILHLNICPGPYLVCACRKGTFLMWTMTIADVYKSEWGINWITDPPTRRVSYWHWLVALLGLWGNSIKLTTDPSLQHLSCNNM